MYRIIDANFNRAREAVRVIEEYCRFALNNSDLSARAKSMRHAICETVNKLDSEVLIGCRDSESDIGRVLSIDNQMKRSDLKDCCTAASKRLTEALRSLSEVTQTVNQELPSIFEELRFKAYSLEKDILINGNAEKIRRVRLYIILTVKETNNDLNILELAEKCIKGGADCIQFRPVNINDLRAVKLAKEIVQNCTENNVLSIINNRIDIACASLADGIHLGKDDLPIEYARKIQIKPILIGLTTHSITELEGAIKKKPDYVGIGPVYKSPSKPEIETAGLDYIKKATKRLSETTTIIPVAIGGINLENINFVLKAGARAVAVGSAVTECNDPEEECKRLKNIILEY